ncbi:TraR/DksA family transcriptional regulator [Streptomyces sp. NPDC058953]|uniref:TraR/DksA family transcriptional regulator n=1 Tax=unclassified Streptomyces TaxID=2593676 RepID=UPI0036A720CF
MVAKKTAAKKSAARKAVVDDAAATPEKAAEKAPAKKAAAAKKAAPAKKTAVRGAAPEKAPAGKSAPAKKAAKKTAAKKAPAEKKTVAKKAVAKKAVAKKTVAKKTVAKKAVAKKTAGTARKAVKQTGARTVGAKKTVAVGDGPTAVPTARAAAAPAEDLVVRPGEEPWSAEEVAEAEAVLRADVARLNAELAASEAAVAGLMRDSGGGAGDDDADTGTKNITREHELSLAANARETLEQTERALLRLDAGTYGICENCGKPIGKARMQAFPRATLCVECKQKQERRG